MVNITAGTTGSLFVSEANTLTFSISSCIISCYNSYDPVIALNRIEFLTNSIGGLIKIANA